MKIRYYSILLILLSSIFFEYSKSIKGLKAQSYNTNFKSDNFSIDNGKINLEQKNNDLIKESFYKKGYTFEESLKLKNQIFNLFGISFKNKKLIFGFPEQRIESDAFGFWNAYKDTLRNQIQKDAKITNDLDNGFNSSLFQ